MMGFDVSGYLLGMAATIGYLRARIRDIADDVKELNKKIERLEDDR
jgi:outer membrane murein-binding lipoprotein Lpp